MHSTSIPHSDLHDCTLSQGHNLLIISQIRHSDIATLLSSTRHEVLEVYQDTNARRHPDDS
jgi:hypothetical protein